MTQYSLWQSGTGGLPSSGGPLVPYTSTPVIVATQFCVAGGGNWLDGYYMWVPSGGDTAPAGGYKAALWSVTVNNANGYLVPDSVATAATMTANSWNFMPLPAPIQLGTSWDTNASTSGSIYMACIGWTPSFGFPDTNGYWGSGGAGQAGITSGDVLMAYSGGTGTGNHLPFSMPSQGLFSLASNDPTTVMPVTTSNVDNFWVDVLVDTVAPVSYSGSYRLWPNKGDANGATSGDLNVNYTIATEMSLTQTCTLNNIWYFSPSGATTLATRAAVWSIATGLEVATIASPSWTIDTGAAFTAGTTPYHGQGTWIKAAFTGGTTLGAGDYRVSVYNSAGTTDTNWGPKDAATDYWGETLTGAGANGITWGPLAAPNYAGASSGFLFDNANPGASPPFSNGTVPHAQPVFAQTTGGAAAPTAFPQLFAPVGGSSNETQNYWVDLEVTPQSSPPAVQQPPFLYVMRRV